MGIKTTIWLLVITIYCRYVGCMLLTTSKDVNQDLLLGQYGIDLQGNQLTFGLKIIGSTGTAKVKCRKSENSILYRLYMNFKNKNEILVKLADADFLSLGIQKFSVVNNCIYNCQLWFQTSWNATHFSVVKIENGSNQKIYFEATRGNPKTTRVIGIRSSDTDAEWTFLSTEHSSQASNSYETVTQLNHFTDITDKEDIQQKSTSDIDMMLTSSTITDSITKSDKTSTSNDVDVITTSPNTNTAPTQGTERTSLIATVPKTSSGSTKSTNEPSIESTSSSKEVTASCQKVKMRNVTIEEMQQMITQLRSELIVNKTELSSFIRARTSATDKRGSAVVIGYIGTSVIIAPMVTIVLLDLPHFCRFLTFVKQLRKRKLYP